MLTAKEIEALKRKLVDIQTAMSQYEINRNVVDVCVLCINRSEYDYIRQSPADISEFNQILPRIIKMIDELGKPKDYRPSVGSTDTSILTPTEIADFRVKFVKLEDCETDIRRFNALTAGFGSRFSGDLDDIDKLDELDQEFSGLKPKIQDNVKRANVVLKSFTPAEFEYLKSQPSEHKKFMKVFKGVQIYIDLLLKFHAQIELSDQIVSSTNSPMTNAFTAAKSSAATKESKPAVKPESSKEFSGFKPGFLKF